MYSKLKYQSVYCSMESEVKQIKLMITINISRFCIYGNSVSDSECKRVNWCKVKTFNDCSSLPLILTLLLTALTEKKIYV